MNKLPVPSLIKINWLISITCALLILIYMVSLKVDVKIALPRSLQVLVLVSMITSGNVMLQNFLLRKKDSSPVQIRKMFYFCSYLFAILAWFIIKNVYSLVTGEEWEGESRPVLATVLAVLTIIILNTFIIIIHSLIILQDKKAKSEMENLRLKAKESEIKNLLLRQQIHPHFLFNSLNTIKSLYRINPEKAQSYLVHLANFLRVAITNQHTQTTLIRNELAFCEDYLKMQHIRFGQALQYVMEISKETSNNKFIPYFSLQPLIENVLKHNELSDKNPLRIEIIENDGYLYVLNNIREKSFKEPSTGTGLSSLSERYRLLGAEKIKIEAIDGMFKVGIKMLPK